MADDFFQFFHLREAGRQQRDRGALVTFKPQAPTFRPHVTLAIEVDDADRVASSSLALTGAFIGDPANALFALDIAKSYLKAVVPGEDALDIAQLVHELRNLPSLQRGDIELPHAPNIRLPHVLSEGIMAYAGLIGGTSLSEAGSRISVRSEGESLTDRSVTFSVSAADERAVRRHGAG